jgi:hypothetical protein
MFFLRTSGHSYRYLKLFWVIAAMASPSVYLSGQQAVPPVDDFRPTDPLTGSPINPPANSVPAVPILRFGRTPEQLFELISICSGPNLDYSVSDEEYKQIQLAAKQRLAFIQSEPDLAAILVDHVDRMIDGNSTMPSSLTGIFRALALRPDVDPAAVRRYALLASDLQSKADHYKTTPFPREKSALMSGIQDGLPNLLGAYPTREGEDYLITMLEHPVIPSEFPMFYKKNAARAAAKSGTIRCLPGLAQTLSEYERVHEAQMKEGNTGLSDYVNELRDCVKKFRERITRQNQHD